MNDTLDLHSTAWESSKAYIRCADNAMQMVYTCDDDIYPAIICVRALMLHCCFNAGEDSTNLVSKPSGFPPSVQHSVASIFATWRGFWCAPTQTGS